MHRNRRVEMTVMDTVPFFIGPPIYPLPEEMDSPQFIRHSTKDIQPNPHPNRHPQRPHLLLTDQRNRHIVAPKLHSVHLCIVAELINDKANTDMKNRTILIIALVAVLTLPPFALAQGGQGQNGPNAQARTAQPSIQFPPGWKPYPRSQNNDDRSQEAVQNKTKGHPLERHDLTGVWGYNGNQRA